MDRKTSSIIVLFLFIGYFLILFLLSETSNYYEETNYSAQEVSTILREAKTFKVEKNYESLLKNDYNIIVNEEIVATVTGEYIKLFGDVFTLRSSNGELMLYESEEILHLNNQAGVYNPNNEEIGRIESSYINLLYESHFYKNGQKIATCQEHLDIPREDTIRDSYGNLLYTISQEDVVASFYEVNVINNKVISPEIAIFFGCINDAIATSSD